MACPDASWLAPVELFGQRRVGEPLVAHRDRVAALRDVAALLEEAARGVARIDRQLRGAAGARELLQRVGKHAARALPGGVRMDVEHADLVLTLERGEADRLAVERRDERQLAAELGREIRHIVGRSGPRFLLRLAVVVAGQRRDGFAEDLRERRGVVCEEWPQRELRGAHRAISQVVPSLESLSTTPIAASSSRMRSDSLKSFALRAAALASINCSTFAASTVA